MLDRRKSTKVMIGNVAIGGDEPVAVQSMTNTDTADITSTVNQILELSQAGSEMARITVNNEDSAKAVPFIIEKLHAQNCNIPIIGDFHYNGHILLTQYPDCAKSLAKYRINPGNVGFGQKKDTQFQIIIEKAIEYNKPVRIGVNWGSIDQSLLAKMMDDNAKLDLPLEADIVKRQALIKSAIDSAAEAHKIGLTKNKIILSCKVSNVQELIKLYSELGDSCTYPLHLGLTEAGIGDKGIISSTAALSILLQQGIGDTIRVSLTPKPNSSRTREVHVAQEILQSLDIRSFTPQVISCPGCGRTTSVFFQQLAGDIQDFLRESMLEWKKIYNGVENMDVAVMGCIVNGPGESKNANIGISLPGTGESPIAPVFIDGKKEYTLRGENITQEFKEIVNLYVENKYK